MLPLRAWGQDRGCFGASGLSKSTPTRAAGAIHPTPRPEHCCEPEPGLRPVLATPPWRAHDLGGSRRRKLRLRGGGNRPRSGAISEPRGRELKPGVRVETAAGTPPGAEAPRGGGGRVTLSCCAVGLRLRLRARRGPAPAPAPLGAGMERAPGLRPAARAHFLVSAPNSLLLALSCSRPPSLPSPGLCCSPLPLPLLPPPCPAHSPFALLAPHPPRPPRSPTFS